MTNGRKSNRCYPEKKVEGGLGPTIAWSWKAFSGCSKPARAGVTCQKNTPAPPPAGGAWLAGKSKASGSTSGGRFCPNWMREARWTGRKVFWMRVSLRLKKGLRSRQNQKGKGHEMDGGGRRLGCSSGKPTRLGHPGGSNPGRKHASKHFRSPAARTPSQKAFARHCRPGLRQRSVARAVAQTGNPVDRASSQKPHQTFAQRWTRTAQIPQTLEGRTHLRLARQLPPLVGK